MLFLSGFYYVKKQERLHLEFSIKRENLETFPAQLGFFDAIKPSKKESTESRIIFSEPLFIKNHVSVRILNQEIDITYFRTIFKMSAQCASR